MKHETAVTQRHIVQHNTVSPKLLGGHESPEMNTLICQISAKVGVPPSGNRKSHVIYFEILVHQIHVKSDLDDTSV